MIRMQPSPSFFGGEDFRGAEVEIHEGPGGYIQEHVDRDQKGGDAYHEGEIVQGAAFHGAELVLHLAEFIL